MAPMSAMRWPVDRAPERSIRLLCVQPDPDDREAVAPRGGERVAKAGVAVVETVVVGHRRDVHTPGRERGEGARRRSEDERLGRRRPVRRDRGLEIHDGEVGTAKYWADGSEEEVGRGAELRSDRPFEVDVTAERELDRPTGRALPASLADARLRAASTRRRPKTAPTSTATVERGDDDGESEFHDSMHEVRPEALHDSRALTRIAKEPGVESLHGRRKRGRADQAEVRCVHRERRVLTELPAEQRAQVGLRQAALQLVVACGSEARRRAGTATSRRSRRRRRREHGQRGDERHDCVGQTVSHVSSLVDGSTDAVVRTRKVRAVRHHDGQRIE